MARILIADDRESMRGALKTFVALNPEWTVCGEAGMRTRRLRKLRNFNPDVIILDYKMPDSTASWQQTGYLESYQIFHRDVHAVQGPMSLKHAANLMGIRVSSAKKRASLRCSAQLRMNSAAQLRNAKANISEIVGSSHRSTPEKINRT